VPDRRKALGGARGGASGGFGHLGNIVAGALPKGATPGLPRGNPQRPIRPPAVIINAAIAAKRQGKLLTRGKINPLDRGWTLRRIVARHPLVFASSFTRFSHLKFTTEPTPPLLVEAAMLDFRVVRLRNRLRAFLAARGGNVAVIFALSLIPIVGLVGAAVDYSRANAARTAMQSAVDSTALMLSRTITTMTSDQITQTANSYFNAMFNRPDVTGIVVTPTYTTSGGSQIVVTASGMIKTNFLNVLGLISQAQDWSHLKIGASATIKWGNTRLRVALALDVTGSMAWDGKMTAMQTAAKNLLTQLKNAANKDGDVYVSIIPFNKDIAVVQPSSTHKENWVRWDLWDEKNGSCNKKPKKGSYNTKTECEQNGGMWTIADHSSWNGCITDRDKDYDTKNTAPSSGIPATLFPAEQYGSCPEPVMSLSYNWILLNQKIDALKPRGNTNQPIGLVHAWQSLAGGGPYPPPPAKDPNYQYSEVIILLSDGLNTENRWDKSQSSIDARQQITCNNIKAAGITLYTIQVNTSGDPTSAVLKNCASDPSKFFLLTSANQIVTTFQQIGTALSNLRVAQ